MGEHRHNPVVKWLEEHVGFVRMSISERKSMKDKAHGEVVTAYFEKNPRKSALKSFSNKIGGLKMNRWALAIWYLRRVLAFWNDLLSKKEKDSLEEAIQVLVMNGGGDPGPEPKKRFF